MTNDSPKQVNVNISALEASAQIRLQHIVDRLDLSLRCLRKADAESSTIVSPLFFRMDPAPQHQLPHTEAIESAEQWYFRNSLTDAIEVVGIFLESCRHACAAFNLGAGPHKAQDVQAAVAAGQNAFRKRGLPHKLDYLRDNYGVQSSYKDHLLSLNQARNCLVHRQGKVSDADTDTNGVLTLNIYCLALEAVSPDGDTVEPINYSGYKVKEGWTTRIRTKTSEHHFYVGDILRLRPEEYSYCIVTISRFAATMAKSVSEFGKSMGVQESRTKDNKTH